MRSKMLALRDFTDFSQKVWGLYIYIYICIWVMYPLVSYAENYAKSPSLMGQLVISPFSIAILTLGKQQGCFADSDTALWVSFTPRV